MAHGLSCSMACGIFSDQGSNLFEPGACALGNTEWWVVEERVKWGGVTGLWDLARVFLSLDSSICEMGVQAPLSSREM